MLWKTRAESPAALSRGEPLRTSAPASAWMQRVAGLRHLPSLLRQRGVEPDAVLGKAGLHERDFRSPDDEVSFLAVARVLAEARRATRCAHFGVLLGREWRLADIGLLGELVRLGPTVGDGLRGFVSSQQLFSEGTMPYLLEFPNVAEFGFAVFHPDSDDLVGVLDCAMAATVSCLRDVFGEDWSPSELHLPHAPPLDTRAYRDHFRCPVSFEEERASIFFPGEVLARPVPRPDPARLRVVQSEVSERLRDDLVSVLYRSLRLIFLQARTPTMQEVAQRLAMHPRTLHRRLDLQGTSYRRVLDDVRFEVARHLLRDSGQPVGHIARILGYGDDTAFSRAFRRWSGTTPTEWRAAARPD